MKEVIACLLFMMMCLNLEGHEDFVFEIETGQLSFTVGTGFRENEFQKQGFILKDICVDYLSNEYEGKNHPKIFIWLFESYLSAVEENMVMLGIDSVEVNERDHSRLRSSRNKNASYEEAIIVYIESRIIKGETVLKLLDFALKNRDYIQTNQRDTTIFVYEQLKTISAQKIEEILNKENVTIEKHLSKKNWRSRSRYYYYSNDRYYFPNREDSTIIKLELDHVFEIVDFPNQGLLVFNTDSSFYYLPRRNETIQGPHRIKNVLKGRIPLMKDWGNLNYVYDTHSDSLNRFEMVLNKSPIESRARQKVLFFPLFDKTIVDYGEIEKNELLRILNSSAKENNSTKRNFFIAVLLLSVLLNVYLFKRIKSSRNIV